MALVNHNVHDSFGKAPMGRVVNHYMMDCSDRRELERLEGLERYSVRPVCTTQPGDVVQLHPNMREAWQWAQVHFRRIGLPVAQDIVWNDQFDVAASYPGLAMDVFLFGNEAHRVRPDQRWFDIVAEMNDKNRTLWRAQQLGIPIPETLFFNSKDDVGDVARFTYPIFLKLAISVSGLGVWKCEKPEQLEQRLSEISDGVAFQLQQPEDAEFLNVQYECPGDGTARRLLVTEQILVGSAHAGNKPTWHQPWLVTDPLARYMAQNGMKGKFAFDVAALKKSGYVLIECNPRWNGASYPTVVAERLGVGQHWLARNFQTSAKDLASIDLNGYEYDARLQEGVIAINWGVISEGKIGLMVTAQSAERRVQIEQAIEELLNS